MSSVSLLRRLISSLCRYPLPPRCAIRGHFGRRGLVIFLAIFVVYGNNIIVFGAGVAPVIGDALCWATMAILAQGVMRLIAGPAKADRLARSPTTEMRKE